MRLLVASGRHLDDVALIRKALGLIHRQTPLGVLIHGGHAFSGVALEDWARERDIHILRYPANWRLHGKRAEGIRNAFMLQDSRPDLVLALPGGADTCLLARCAAAQGLRVLDHQGRLFAPGHSPRITGGDDPEPDPEPDVAAARPAPAPARAAAH